MITFQDIAVCYKARERYPVNALEEINLHISPGEWVFLVGPSGAGKSTLLKLLYHGHGAEALHGRITVDGNDITHLKPNEIALLRRKVGVVFQDFQLLTQKTVWENVAFALQVIGTPQSRQVKDVPTALETVGLMHKAHARPHELSGGEQQRVAIARAIVNNPTVLLLDEPTGNLDPQTASDIAEVLRKVNARGTTILMATHDRNLVDSMKKRVVRIAHGSIVSDEEQGIYHPEDDWTPTIAAEPSVFIEEPPVVTHQPVEAAALVEAAPSTVEIWVPSETRPDTPAPSAKPRGAEPTVETARSEFPRGEALAEPKFEPRAEPKLEPRMEKPLPRMEPPVADYVTSTLENHAPLGSPENPIVQLDRL
ncbi:MAG TPA: cell division ATP-binding protein FtsE [Abditibacteriaceae bacterium]|jgi:cell division transport system ATP-binding protein